MREFRVRECRNVGMQECRMQECRNKGIKECGVVAESPLKYLGFSDFNALLWRWSHEHGLGSFWFCNVFMVLNTKE